MKVSSWLLYFEVRLRVAVFNYEIRIIVSEMGGVEDIVLGSLVKYICCCSSW